MMKLIGITSILLLFSPIILLGFHGDNKNKKNQSKKHIVIEYVPLGTILEIPPDCNSFHRYISPSLSKKIVIKYDTKHYQQMDSLFRLFKEDNSGSFKMDIRVHVEYYENNRLVNVICGNDAKCFILSDKMKPQRNDALYSYIYSTFGVN